MGSVLTAAIVVAIHLFSVTAAPAADSASSFRRDVARIFIERCVACHRFDRAEGGYRADNYASIVGVGDSDLSGVIKGKPGESEVFRRVIAEDPAARMPFEGEPLPADEIAVLKAWILAGASYDAKDPTAALATIVPAAVYPKPPRVYPASWPIAALAFSRNEEQLYVGGYHEVTVWTPKEGRLIARLANLPERILGLSLHPDGRQLAVAGGQPGRVGDVRVIDVETQEVTRVLLQAVGVALNVEWSPGGDRLAVSAADGAVRVYDASSGTVSFTVRPHSDWVYATAWSTDGKQLTTGSRDGTAKVLATDNGRTLASYRGHGKPVRGLAFTPDGKYVFSAAGKEVHRWKTDDGNREGDPITLEGEVTGMVGRGATFFVATDAPKLYRVDGTTAKLSGEAIVLRELPLSVATSNDGMRVAVGHFDGQVGVWVGEAKEQTGEFSATPVQ